MWRATKESVQDDLDLPARSVQVRPHTIQMQCLRRISRVSRREHAKSARILGGAKMKTVLEVVRFNRLRWLGHVQIRCSAR